MAIQNIVSSDKLQSGFRAKYNTSIDEIWVSGVDLGNGTLRVTKHNGDTYDIDLTTSFYTKAQTEVVLDDFMQQVTAMLGPLSPVWLYQDSPYFSTSGGGVFAITDFENNFPGLSENGVVRMQGYAVVDGSEYPFDLMPDTPTRDGEGNIIDTLTFYLGYDSGAVITTVKARLY